MNNKTVSVYTDEEFNTQGLSDAVKSKTGRRSVFLPLVFSVVAAFVFWLVVVWGNNTCSGIPVQVLGNDQLMSNNFTISSIEPSSVDLVLRGKGEVIDRIMQDQSLISASVNVFDPGSSNALFESVDEIKEGKYTVALDVALPEGVSCSTKSVTITVSKASHKEFSTALAGTNKEDDVKLHMSNYSFANGISLDRQAVVEELVTVIGDEKTLAQVDHIALNIDWLKDLTGDATVYVTPVACDRFGDEIESRFLRFEPETLEVNIKVNKYKYVLLAPKTAPKDDGAYTLSLTGVGVIGPVFEIDRIPDVIEVDVSQDVRLQEYTILSREQGSGVRIMTDEGEYTELTVTAEKKSTIVKLNLLVKTENMQVIPPLNGTYTLDKDRITVQIEYYPVGIDTPKLTDENLLVTLDLSGLKTGQTQVEAKVGFVNVGDVSGAKVVEVEKLTVTLETDPPAEVAEL